MAQRQYSVLERSGEQQQHAWARRDCREGAVATWRLGACAGAAASRGKPHGKVATVRSRTAAIAPAIACTTAIATTIAIAIAITTAIAIAIASTIAIAIAVAIGVAIASTIASTIAIAIASTVPSTTIAATTIVSRDCHVVGTAPARWYVIVKLIIVPRARDVDPSVGHAALAPTRHRLAVGANARCGAVEHS